MSLAIPRYGIRHVSGSTQTALDALKRGTGVQGPEIGQFEKLFARYHGVENAISASYGRMAFYYILQALDFPRGSEIIFPALTFWVVPEMARICGLRPVFVDIDPNTFNLDPVQFESAITPNARAVVPTHLYGQPCDMQSIMPIARSHGLAVIEDCAHSLGATYRGRLTGTFGDAAFFSFQMLKGLNAYGGGMAITANDTLGTRIRKIAEAEPWPDENDVRRRIRFGELQRGMISPLGFSLGLFAGFYLGALFGAQDLSRFLWEKIRPLQPLPDCYRRRFSNAQAAVALQGMERLDEFNERTREHAARLTRGLQGVRAIVAPMTIAGAQPVYYQYCVRVSEPGKLSRRAIFKGIDVEIMHVDICNTLPLFSDYAVRCPAAESTADTLQLPVYSRLRPEDIDRILRVIRAAAEDLPLFKASCNYSGSGP